MRRTNSKKLINRTQLQVLLATLQLFNIKGYFNTSVHDIVRESGVSIGSIYHHFKDKEGIARALYQTLLQKLSNEISELIETYPTYEQCSQAVIHYLFELTEQEPEIMEFLLYARHRQFMPDEVSFSASQPFELLNEIVQKGMDAGEINSMDISVACNCLFGGTLRLITAQLDGSLDKPLSSYIEPIWRCSWKSVASAA